MPIFRAQEVLEEAGLEDTPENRTLVEEIAGKKGVTLLPDLESHLPPDLFPEMVGPPEPPTSYGVTESFPTPQPKIIPRGTQLGYRMAAGAIEGTTQPILQLLGEASSRVRERFPGGKLGLEDFMEREGLLGQATLLDRIASKTGYAAAFFAPISAAGRAIRAAGVVPKSVAWMTEMTLVGLASVLDTRSQTGKAGVPHLGMEELKSFGESFALMGAGAAVGGALTKGVSKLLQRPLSDAARQLISNPTVGALLGVYSGHKGKMGREQLAEEAVASALGFTLGGFVGHVFTGASRPTTARRAEASVDAATDAISSYSERPFGKFEKLAEQVPEAKPQDPAYRVKVEAATNFWVNAQVPVEKTVRASRPISPETGEKVGPETVKRRVQQLPTWQQLRDAYEISDRDAQKIVRERLSDAEIAESRKNQTTNLVLEEAERRGTPVLQETLYRMGLMPAAERRLYEIQRNRMPPDARDQLVQQVPTVREALEAQPKESPPPAETPELTKPDVGGVEPTQAVSRATPQPQVRVRPRTGPGRAIAGGRAPEAAPAPEGQTVGLGATVGTRSLAAPSASSALPPAVTGREEVAPTNLPPRSSAPPAPELGGREAAQRLREIRTRLQEKGLPPAERASLQQERTRILGTDLPFDTEITRRATFKAALQQKPTRLAQSPVPKAEGLQAQAEAKVRAADAAIQAAKPKELGKAGDATFYAGVDPELLKNWMEGAARRLPKKNPPEYEALNKGRPGPRAIERMVADIEDLFFERGNESEQTKALIERYQEELGLPKTAKPTMRATPFGDIEGRFIWPAIDYIRGFGPAGKALGDGMMRVWRRVLSQSGDIDLDLDEQEMRWGAYKKGKVKNWSRELGGDEWSGSRAALHDWTDAYAQGKRGKELPALPNDETRLMAAAWTKMAYGERPFELNEAEARVVDGFADWNRGFYGWFLQNSVEQGLPTKAYAGSQYWPRQLRKDVFAPIVVEDWIEKGTPMVRTDQGAMTKTEFVDRTKRAKELQDAIIEELVRKGRPEAEVRNKLTEYHDKYQDPYVQAIVDRFQQGVNEPETNLTLHRYFDVDVGVETDLSRLFRRYMRSNLLAIEMAREWGPNREKAEALISAAGMQGYEKKPLAEAFDIAMLQDPKASRQSSRLMSELRGWAMFSLLGKTVFLQVPQDVMTSAYVGLSNHLKTIPATLRAQIYRDPNLSIAFRQKHGDRIAAKWAALSGALVDSEIHTVMEQLHGWGPKAAAFMLAKTGMRLADFSNRAHAAIAGNVYLDDLLHRYRYATNDKARSDAAAKIREVLQDPKDVESALSGKWVRDKAELERLTAMAGEAVAYRTQFRTLPIEMPLARTDSRFRGMYDLMGFTYRATRESMRVMNLRNPSSPLRNPSTALRWLSGVAAAGVSAQLVSRLRDAVLGKEPEDDPWWVTVRDTIVQLGIMQIYKDVADTARGKYGNPALTLVGPYAEFGGKAVEAVGRSVYGTSPKPLYRYLARRIPETPYEKLGPGKVREKLQEAGAPERKSRVRVRRKRRPAV